MACLMVRWLLHSDDEKWGTIDMTLLLILLGAKGMFGWRLGRHAQAAVVPKVQFGDQIVR